ncbi:hypothetical protein MMG00_09030 [Ignatzschineria rhizosphaerae]|uniref:Uncharacterized protein n=1 Tax=Ignatzschineria rhizosphaerae TaxID=2923279 RepID=A0ABY3X3N1_9GAMM|nr:hypothetical protein [Ignatzschineria rhizosphaerae]UNM95370.1 hypothetical protein MMG00_09030 [Ignatzschineria rhizosphaerae]
MPRKIILILLTIGLLIGCAEEKPLYFDENLTGYCRELNIMYSKKNEMLMLLGTPKAEIERDHQAQLQFIHEELEANSDLCLSFLKGQMDDFLGQ